MEFKLEIRPNSATGGNLVEVGGREIGNAEYLGTKGKFAFQGTGRFAGTEFQAASMAKFVGRLATEYFAYRP